MSDAFTGFHCGRLITGGAGKDSHGRASNGRRQVIHHVYGANFGKTPIRPGDSGAPVFTGDGVALGVLLARQAKHHTSGFSSQIRNVEDVAPGGISAHCCTRPPGAMVCGRSLKPSSIVTSVHPPGSWRSSAYSSMTQYSPAPRLWTAYASASPGRALVLEGSRATSSLIRRGMRGREHAAIKRRGRDSNPRCRGCPHNGFRG